MPLFVCSKCECIENTALGEYWMIKNHKEYLKIIYKNIKLVLNESQIYLFGSIIEGNLVVASDIDILII